jgi:hypothetical protein
VYRRSGQSSGRICGRIVRPVSAIHQRALATPPQHPCHLYILLAGCPPEALKQFVALHFCRQGWHCGESVVEDDMKLWRNVPGCWIVNERNRRGVFGGETDEDALPCPAFPFWNLMSVLQLRIKYINGATENMCSWETRTGRLDA